MSKKLLRKRLALMLANLKKPRPYYCEVEYLETTNQQSNQTTTDASWINTGISPTSSTKMECKTQFTTLISGNGTEALFGSTGSSGNPRFAFGYASLSPYLNFYVGLGAQNLTTSVVRDTNVHTFTIDAPNNLWSIDDTTGTFTSAGTLSNTNPICLFGRQTANYTGINKPANAKTYYCKIWNNGTLVRDLIPVLDWDYVPCMYDKVSGQLFYNQGTGDFSYGREIHEVEYLESTGTQYIDTGINASGYKGCELKACYTTIIDNTFFIGAYNTDGVDGFQVGSFNNKWRLKYGNAGYFGPNVDTNVHIFKANTPEGSYVDDTLLGTSYISIPNSATRNLYLFKRNASNTSNEVVGNIYYCKLYDNNTLVRDYIPAIDENGVGFMFDRASHTIYDNAGTGTFKYPTIELEYIESDGNQYIDTGVVLSSTDKVEVSVEYTGTPTQGSSYAFGTFGSNKNFGINCTLKSTPKSWYGVWYNQGILTSSTIFSDLNTRYDIQVSSNGMYINDNLMTTVSGTFTGSVSAYLFWAHGTGQPKSLMRLYSCKMWQSDTLVRDFIPIIKDGVAGMWDKANNVFYANAGTGNFVSGRILEKEYE